jgi:hypothetical protein
MKRRFPDTVVALPSGDDSEEDGEGEGEEEEEQNVGGEKSSMEVRDRVKAGHKDT